MKIAICICGEPRRFIESSYLFKENIIKIPHDVDVYVHTWCSESIPGMNNVNNYMCEFKYNKDLLYDLINKYYNPKKVLVEDKDIIFKYDWVIKKDSDLKSVRSTNIGGYCQYYSISRCVELLRGDYDIVVKTRFDLVLNNKITNNNNFINIVSGKYDIRTPWISIYNGYVIVENTIFYGKCNSMVRICKELFKNTEYCKNPTTTLANVIINNKLSCSSDRSLQYTITTPNITDNNNDNISPIEIYNKISLARREWNKLDIESKSKILKTYSNKLNSTGKELKTYDR